MAEIENTLTWSSTRARTFGTCKRRYYLQYYQKWGGWLDDSPEDQRLAYRLSKMTALPLLVGTAVHETIKLIISRLAWGHDPLPNPGHYARKTFMTQVWRDAERERWRKNPKYHPPVFELYYGQLPSSEELKAYGMQVSRALHTFLQTTVFRSLRAEDSASWLTLDRGPGDGTTTQPSVDDVPVWAIPDFARRVSENRCEIWDWKTGRPRDSDELQLLAYGLYAHQVWGFPADAIDLYACYLDPNKAARPVVPFSFNEAQLARVIRTIREDVAAMGAVLEDAENHRPKPKETFPMTERQGLCERCAFKEICQR